jgi:hypothetical protein
MLVGCDGRGVYDGSPFRVTELENDGAGAGGFPAGV